MSEFTIWIKIKGQDPEVYCEEKTHEKAIETAYMKWVTNMDKKTYGKHKAEYVFEAVWVEDENDCVVWDSDDLVMQAKAEAEEILNNLKVRIDGNNIIIDDGFSVESYDSHEPDVDDVAEKLEMYVYSQGKVIRNDDLTELLEKKAEEVFKI